jgi:hypothetical protein
MTFRLYNVAQNGVPLWSETQILGTRRGLFSAVLGDITPFPDSLRFDRPYWLGIQVSPDPELLPRIQLTATGYSLRSRTADTALYARTGGTGIQGIQNTDSTLAITNPAGPTATVNTRIPLSLDGNWNGEEGALKILGDKPTIRFTGGAISGNESWIMHLGSDGPGNLSFFRRSDTATWMNVMSLATNGNVGIGTSIPSARLEVNSGTGVGIVGSSTSSGSTEGVFGSSLDVGVKGIGAVVGVWGHRDGGGAGVLGSSTVGTGVEGTSPNIGVTAYSAGGTAIYCTGTFYQDRGIFEAHPTTTIWSTNKPATVKLRDGTPVKLFTEEAAEIYFNDYGEGQLVNGRTHVELDPKFLQTVTIDDHHPLKVFIQEAGECNGMYFTNRTSTGFDVAEMHNGSSNAPFVYRVVCKRKYYEDERLASQEDDIKYNTHVLQNAWPEVLRKSEELRAGLDDIASSHQDRPQTKK